MITCGEKIGRGAEAGVFEDTDNPDQVIVKIKPTGYTKLLVYAQQHILHKLAFEDGFFVAWIDRCTCWDGASNPVLEAVFDILQTVGDCSPVYFTPLPQLDEYHTSILRGLGIDIIEIIESVKARGDNPESFVLDLRGSNIMIKPDGSIVLTDPIINTSSFTH